MKKLIFGYGVTGKSVESYFQKNKIEYLIHDDKNLNIGPLNKGDTLRFSMTGVTKRTPSMEIVNGSKELLFSNRRSKNTVEAVIPVLSKDSFQITMISKAWFGQENKFRVERITPFKYVLDTNLIPKPIVYDTIPIDFLDTTIYLGAVRDFTNSNSEKFTFNFKADTSIAFWSVVFGTGVQIEHLMAAIFGKGIDNLLIEIEFSLNALRASPFDFKKDVLATKSEIISIPLFNSESEISACGTPSKTSKTGPCGARCLSRRASSFGRSLTRRRSSPTRR